MQRTVIILACFFIGANCIAQSAGPGGQYPFVHYTPKDGLISNQIKNIYQDSKGRLYFSSFHGLSVYDGSRFINYNSKNGLNFDMVNCVMEMGDDSVWIVTNSTKINCLVKGKMKIIPLRNTSLIINNLSKDQTGSLYAASEEGLYLFNKDRFDKLPLKNLSGKEIDSYIAYAASSGDYLLIQQDNSMLPDPQNVLYLYNKRTKEVIDEIPHIYSLQIAPDGRIWVSTDKHIMNLDTSELKKGKIVLQDLPNKYNRLRDLGRYFILIDQGNNCWMCDQSGLLIKAAPDGNITSFTSASGLSMFFINQIFQDKEGITWIASNNAGVYKLVHTNFSLIEKPFNLSAPFNISYNEKEDRLLLYSLHNKTVALIHKNKVQVYAIKNLNDIRHIVETPNGIFGVWLNTVYKLIKRDHTLYPVVMLTDSIDNVYSGTPC